MTYDVGDIGNPKSFDGWTLDWQHGRQLASMSKTGQTLTFEYDAGGLRTRKVDSIEGTTDYTLHGKLITHLKKGNNNLHFFYDAQSRPAMVDFNGTIYTYAHNLQGDIVGMVDADGHVVVEYKYDAWGMPTQTTVATGSTSSTLTTAYATLAALNPFRYRGYVWDEETKLYYLRSRYYNPEWGRFINCDAQLGKNGSLLSHNIFDYCANNPVICSDPNGEYSILDMIGVNGRSEKIRYYSEHTMVDDPMAAFLTARWLFGDGSTVQIRNPEFNKLIAANDNFVSKMREFLRKAQSNGSDSFSTDARMNFGDTISGGFDKWNNLINSVSDFHVDGCLTHINTDAGKMLVLK